jgi:argininosuccinate lyase
MRPMAKRLWDKGEPVNARMQFLTVGDDPQIDLRLVPHDAVGSAAHARMLSKQGILSSEACQQLISSLSKIYAEGINGQFAIPEELEDVHTAVEDRLQSDCGEVGKRIHAARSRNDQVCLAVRLYMRSEVSRLLADVVACLDGIQSKFEELKDVPMPGYTHLQPAMPSSVGMWLHSYYEGILDLAKDGLALRDSLNVCPLGSGAGFGSNLSIDRDYVASLLGFRDIQRSVIDVNNSRGRFEEKLLHWCVMLAGLLEKWACDIMLFSTQEFGFISLPAELTTGSSIMPQKRNPDLIELLRARPSKIRGALSELTSVTSKLPSSYHRDLQYTKAPLVRGIEELTACLEMFSLSVAGISVNKQKLEDAMYPELYATYYANNLVSDGMSFRDAYRETAAKIKSGELSDVSALKKQFATIQENCLSGMQKAVVEKTSLANDLQQFEKMLEKSVSKVLK